MDERQAWFNNIYATRPVKLRKKYYINTYKDGEFYLQIRFDTKEEALEIMAEHDNWDKLCARVPERQPVQGELELVA